jgi:hypothetical protein
MSATPEPPSAQRRNRVVLSATCAVHRGPSGVTSAAVSKLPDGRIEFAPHVSGACTFTVEEGELVNALVRWL